MLVGDIPVETDQELVVLLVGGESGVGTCIIVITVGHVILDRLKVGQSGARDVVVGIGHSVFRTAPALGNGGSSLPLGIGKEEEFVLQDRTAQSEAPSGL